MDSNNNKGYVIKVTPDWEVVKIPLAEDSLSQLQNIVGGYIERAPTPLDEFDIDLYVDEEGLIKGDEPVLNLAATGIAGYTIVGNAAFVKHNSDGGTIGLSDEESFALISMIVMLKKFYEEVEKEVEKEVHL